MFGPGTGHMTSCVHLLVAVVHSLTDRDAPEQAHAELTGTVSASAPAELRAHMELSFCCCRT